MANAFKSIFKISEKILFDEYIASKDDFLICEQVPLFHFWLMTAIKLNYDKNTSLVIYYIFLLRICQPDIPGRLAKDID